MLAPPLVATTILIWNWQAAFVVTGCLGLVWVVLWLLFYNSPSQHPALSDEEREYIRSGQEKHLDGTGRPTIGSILSQRNFWGIALPRFLADPTWGTLTFWLPLYLTTVRHFDLKHIAMFAWLPFLAADFGCMFGGVLGLWFWFRIAPVPTALNEPDAHGRWTLIGVHVALITVGWALAATALLPA